jgi:hypothetical protein
MATAVENGLIVRVISGMRIKKSLLTFSRELKDLAYRARNGGLQAGRHAGATFTVFQFRRLRIGGLFHADREPAAGRDSGIGVSWNNRCQFAARFRSGPCWGSLSHTTTV